MRLRSILSETIDLLLLVRCRRVFYCRLPMDFETLETRCRNPYSMNSKNPLSDQHWLAVTVVVVEPTMTSHADLEDKLSST